MAFDEIVKWAKGMGAGADLVGQRRQAEIDTLAGVFVGLAVQRLMLTELLEQDHRQEIGPEESPRRRVERCRRLGDRLAFPAGELLSDGLDDLPLPRDHLQRLGDILTQFRQAPRAAARTGRRRRNDDPLTRQVFGEWLLGGTLANERPNRRGLGGRFFRGKLILARRRLGVLELHLELIEKAGLALRTCPIKLAPQLLDLQRQMRDQRLGA